MDQEIFDWILLLARWLHITVAVTWIGTSIFFMWLDRSFEFNAKSQNPGHVGDLWMVHGGGFYHVEKLLMGPTKVPEKLHWFKWESYWTWMSGMFLVALIFYTGEGTFLLDSSVSSVTFGQGVAISLFSIFGSWFFYDFLWERSFTKTHSWVGHTFTLLWFGGMSFFLCHTLSGRAAYIHIGGMLGTWMTANVFLRIIPRQILMVEAAKAGQPVNQDWGKNAKNRSTHNTYFTLPVIFIMLSNHFPATYGHDYNWLVLLFISAGGAAIREYFVSRTKRPAHALKFALIGVALITGVIIFTRDNQEAVQAPPLEKLIIEEKISPQNTSSTKGNLRGIVLFEGEVPKGQKLALPAACAKQFSGDVYSNEVMIKNGRIQNVLVRITKGHEGQTFGQAPTEAVELDQKGCLYRPRVIAVRVGQKVEFINSDPVFHNVKSVTTQNQKFNMAMPKKDQREFKIFSHPEIFMQTKCSVHPWMGAYIAVMEHPYFSVTNERGEFAIKDLPVGNYTLEAWHEVFGTQIKEIAVKESNTDELSFIFQAKK